MPTRTANLGQSNGSYSMYETTTWSNKPATQLLAAMATDADHYFENPSSSELANVFTQAALLLVKGGSHLVRCIPCPSSPAPAARSRPCRSRAST